MGYYLEDHLNELKDELSDALNDNDKLDEVILKAEKLIEESERTRFILREVAHTELLETDLENFTAKLSLLVLEANNAKDHNDAEAEQLAEDRKYGSYHEQVRAQYEAEYRKGYYQ